MAVRHWQSAVRLMLTGGMAITLVGTPSAAASAASPDVGRLSDARLIEERAQFGLPVDATSIDRLRVAGADVGSREWGIPMTAAEMDKVDLGRRMAFAHAAAVQVIPRAASAAVYAGSYIDQPAGGGLVILVTARDATLEADIAELMPRDSIGYAIRVVDTSYKELDAARKEAWSAATAGILATPVISTSIDERGNRVRVWVAAEEYPAASRAAARLAAHLGVNVEIKAGTVEDPAACASRNDCHTPFRAGIKVDNCTMGFHIARNAAPADLQFVTTGHCGDREFTHPSFGVIGSTLESEWREGGWDIQRVQMPNSQGTNRIYGESRRVHGRRDPIQDETVCASLRMANLIDCGTVSDADRDYIDGLCGCRIINAADTTGIDIVGGDSGAPVYVRADADSAIAVGLASTQTSDLVAKLGPAFAHWGAGVVINGP